MSSLLFSGGSLLLTYLGQNILLQGITGTSKKIYTQFEKWFYTNCPEVEKILKDMEIFDKLKYIDKLISEIGESFKNSDTVSTILEDIYNSEEKIKYELTQIQIIMVRHKKKYFSKYRKPKYENHITNIKKYIALLDTRIDMLIKLVPLCSVKPKPKSNHNREHLNSQSMIVPGKYGSFKHLKKKYKMIDDFIEIDF